MLGAGATPLLGRTERFLGLFYRPRVSTSTCFDGELANINPMNHTAFECIEQCYGYPSFLLRRRISAVSEHLRGRVQYTRPDVDAGRNVGRAGRRGMHRLVGHVACAAEPRLVERRPAAYYGWRMTPSLTAQATDLAPLSIHCRLRRWPIRSRSGYFYAEPDAQARTTLIPRAVADSMPTATSVN